MSFAVNTIIFCYVNTSITYRVTLTLELEILTRWPRVVLLTLTIPILILVGIWTTVITLHHIRPPAGAAMPVALTYILTTSIADVVAIAIALAEQIPDGVFSAGFSIRDTRSSHRSSSCRCRRTPRSSCGMRSRCRHRRLRDRIWSRTCSSARSKGILIQLNSHHRSSPRCIRIRFCHCGRYAQSIPYTTTNQQPNSSHRPSGRTPPGNGTSGTHSQSNVYHTHISH
jgi:hypothetical protein